MQSNNLLYPGFKWSFSTLGCPEMTLDEICELARTFGLPYAELRATEQRVDLPTLFQEQFDSPESLASYLKDQKIGISCFDTSLKMVGNSTEDRIAFLEFLPWAEATGTQFLRVFDGGTVDTALNDIAYGIACDTIEWWLEERDKSGWKADIAIETHDCLVHIESHQRLAAKYPELKIIWDTHHTWKKGNVAVEASWDQLSQNTCSVHVKDSISEPSARHPFTYVNLGDGEFPLATTLDLLKDNHYQGFVTIEWERMWHPYLPELKEAFTRARELNWF
ncbi:sugar phosphate isomerase/epimerase [Opitutia bacterium ISCC 51]|nr:sugar phosphate isomerase/epimerase [Opitutae bacterium ISCC 51]QXD26913.1 sugar phosphate isomerase/epimerase [Opitutae bacterium ISCC 52]